MEIKYGRKRSGIKRELNDKVNEWLETITDKKVREAAAKEVIVTGGSIASMLLGEQINDFDIYFKTQKTTRLVAEYYVRQFNKENPIKVKEGVQEIKPYVDVVDLDNAKGETESRVVIYIKSAGVAGEDQKEYAYFESEESRLAHDFADSLQVSEPEKEDDKKKPYRVTFMSQNAITLTDKVQIIIRFYGEPDQIHDNYDFVHATCYWDHDKKELVLPAEALEALLSRTLTYRGSLYPVASIFRTKKFLERGWRIGAGQQLKIMWQISELDLSEPEIMREQLTGVDMAYLHQLIQALEGVDPEKINSAYVSTIIDKIFE